MGGCPFNPHTVGFELANVGMFCTVTRIAVCLGEMTKGVSYSHIVRKGLFEILEGGPNCFVVDRPVQCREVLQVPSEFLNGKAEVINRPSPVPRREQLPSLPFRLREAEVEQRQGVAELPHGCPHLAGSEQEVLCQRQTLIGRDCDDVHAEGQGSESWVVAKKHSLSLVAYAASLALSRITLCAVQRPPRGERRPR
jgi:hypothetical protein